jgi:uncharacterized membrane protein
VLFYFLGITGNVYGFASTDMMVGAVLCFVCALFSYSDLRSVQTQLKMGIVTNDYARKQTRTLLMVLLGGLLALLVSILPLVAVGLAVLAVLLLKTILKQLWHVFLVLATAIKLAFGSGDASSSSTSTNSASNKN